MTEARVKLAGYLLALAGLGAGLSAIMALPLLLPAALAAWCAAALVWRRAASRSIIQAAALILAGVAGLAWGLIHAAPVDLQRALTANMGLIGLLIGVSFLQLVSLPASGTQDEPPRGPAAFRSTGLGVHLFGAVINLSTIFLVGNRLRQYGPLEREQIVMLTRFFATAGFWSPFFAAMAAALTFAPEARILHLIAAGVPLAALAMLITWLGTGRHVTDAFVGYPTRYQHLRVPGILAGAVIAIHLWDDSLSVIAVITLLAPLVTAAALLRQRRRGLPVIRTHVTHNLPRMVNELLLFLAAGVMASGLAATLATVDGWSLFTGFGPLEAWLTTLFIIALAVVGLHPVIGVATFGTMLAPLQPDNSLLAISFLAGWALGVTASPLSGINLALQGQFGLDSMRIVRWNAGYTVLMLLALGPAFWLVARLLQV